MPPLRISAEEFRLLAHEVVERAAAFLASLESRRTVSPTSALDTTAAFELPLAEDGLGEAILGDLETITEHIRAPTGRRVHM
jgi:hypothetical protein